MIFSQIEPSVVYGIIFANGADVYAGFGKQIWLRYELLFAS